MRNLMSKEIDVISGGWAANFNDSLEETVTDFGSTVAVGFALRTKIGVALAACCLVKKKLCLLLINLLIKFNLLFR